MGNTYFRFRKCNIRLNFIHSISSSLDRIRCALSLRFSKGAHNSHGLLLENGTHIKMKGKAIAIWWLCWTNAVSIRLGPSVHKTVVECLVPCYSFLVSFRANAFQRPEMEISIPDWRFECMATIHQKMNIPLLGFRHRHSVFGGKRIGANRWKEEIFFTFFGCVAVVVVARPSLSFTLSLHTKHHLCLSGNGSKSLARLPLPLNYLFLRIFNE